MLLENLSKECENTFDFYNNLDKADKLNISAIIFEHINNELINEGNYLTGDEALESNKEVLMPSDLCLSSPLYLSVLFYTSGKCVNNEEPLIPSIIEPYIKKNKNINKALTLFYRLEYIDKLNFLMEMLYSIQDLVIQKHSLDINDMIHNLLDYRNSLSKSSKTSNSILE